MNSRNVSALIHAATIVTADNFFNAKCSPLFEYAPVSSFTKTLIRATPNSCITSGNVSLSEFMPSAKY
jgi:NADH:ubiquinone oxidoreductase subunit 5 (subunit L)/multisubunit Na+/H+ antiporter MnhA subunit